MPDSPPGARIRVMVVDDHALVRAAVRQAMSAPDMEVVAEAASAEDAMTLAMTVRPDVMLVDIDLPGMDGIALVQELGPRLPKTRLVMLTVSADDRHLVEAMRHGAAGYLTKNVAPDALLRAVRSAHNGELAMTRRMAARLVHSLVEGRRPSPAAGDRPIDGLTTREETVLRMLAEGLTDREIADSLTVSPRTVQTHVSNVLHKLGAKNRAEAARVYRDRD